MTKREWQRVENTMRFVVEQQAKFETNFAMADRPFIQAERRLDRLEKLAERVIRIGERRIAKSEVDIADLRAAMKSFLQAMRRSSGNGKA
jgi:hypothetical protein